MTCFNRWIAVLGLLACVMGGTPCRADLFEVDILDAVMTAESRGYIDVILKGTGAPITSFEYTITIVGASESTGNVVFSQQVVDVANIDEYVFFGLSSSPATQISLNSNAELSGNDILGAGTISATGEYLLARLNVEHQGGLNSNLADATFTVSVSQASFYFSVLDDELGEILTPYAPGEVTLGSGTLTITATPEPATLGAFGIASIFALRKIQQRRRKSTKA